MCSLRLVACRGRHLRRRRTAPQSKNVGGTNGKTKFRAAYQHAIHSEHVRAVHGLFGSNCSLALYSPSEGARALPILTALFVLGRILFWVGYHKHPYLRAFGFGITFYPTVAVYIWFVLLIVFGIRIPLF